MRPTASILLIVASTLLVACSSGDEQKAKELVNEFYQMHQSAKLNGALSLNGLISFRHFLSVPLFDLLKDVSVAEEARNTTALATTDDPAPPLVQGDIFTAYPAGATSFRVLQCDMQERDSTCEVELAYSDAQLKAPLKWTDRIMLTRDARGWVIDNIGYAKGAAPMRQGDLQAMLGRALKRDTAPLQ